MEYTDCSKPSNLQSFDLNSMCTLNKGGLRSPGGELFTLLQRTTEFEMSGYSCEVRQSEFTYYCGSFSHSKVATVPTIEISIPLSYRACDQIIATRKSLTQDGGAMYPVEINAETILHLNEQGQLTTKDNAVACRGLSTKVGGELIDNIVKLAQFRIKIQEEKFMVKDQMVEVMSQHERLKCRPTESGCQTNDRTYIWENKQGRCSLEKIQDIAIQKLGTWVIDENKKILLNITGEVQSPVGCPIGKILSTEYKDLFLVSKNKEAKFPELRATNLRIDYQIAGAADYLMYAIEKNYKLLKSQFFTDLCQYRVESFTQGIFKLEQHYGLIRGQALFSFDCKNSIANVREEKYCFDKVPVEPSGFVDPISKLYAKDAARIPCTTTFPLTVKTTTGWIQLSPNIKSVPAPEDRANQIVQPSHEDMSTGGFYTERETIEWEQLINFPVFHEALSRSISSGACESDDTCQTNLEQSGVGYDLRKLQFSNTEWITDPFAKITEWVATYGGYASICVLIGWSFQIIVTLSTLLLAMAREGLHGALAVVCMTCCLPITAWHKIKKNRNRRPRQTEANARPQSMFEFKEIA